METTKQFCSTCHTEHGTGCIDDTILKVYTIAGHDRIKPRRSITDNHGEEFVFIRMAGTSVQAIVVLDQNGRTHVMGTNRFPIIVTTERLL